MNKCDILTEIHKQGIEFDVLEYLARWAQSCHSRQEMENCRLRSSLDLIRKFNDEKWHINVIDSLTEERSNEEVHL